MMPSQSDKADVFKALHARDTIFVMPNPWDAGSAAMLSAFGFEALATTSAGAAHSLGLADGRMSRDAALANARDIVAATRLPVSADLENCYAASADGIAETIRLAAEAGLVGGSIEDYSGDADAPIYPLGQAVERVQAAVEAARSLAFPFILTARCENFLHGRPDLADTIARLQAYQEAGADVLYAPGPRSRDDIARLVTSLDRPVNVLMGLAGSKLSVRDLGEVGVRRVTVGSALSRAAYGAILRGAREIAEHGTFSFAADAASFKEIESLF